MKISETKNGVSEVNGGFPPGNQKGFQRRIVSLLAMGVLWIGAQAWAEEASSTEGRSERVSPVSSREVLPVSKEMAVRRSVSDGLREDAENLREVLAGEASLEAKREAIEKFQAKRTMHLQTLKTSRTETAQEKAVSRQQRQQWIAQLPPERRQGIEAMEEVREEMEQLRSEQSRLTPEQWRERSERLREKRKAAMDKRLAALESPAGSRAEATERDMPPRLESMHLEREKLEEAMKTGDPEERRAAMERFRTRLEEIRQERSSQKPASGERK